MSARVVGLLAVLVLLLATSGCGGDDAPPKRQTTSDQPVKTLAAGTCWGGEQLPEALGDQDFEAWVEKYAGGDSVKGDSMRDDAAFAKEIDCTEPHSLELYDVVEVSPTLTAQVKEYADLLDQKSELYRKIRDQVNDRCMAGTAYGQAQRKAGGLPVQLGPSLNVDGGLRLAWDPFPADLWAKGQHKFVCTFEQDQPGTLRVADLATSKVPMTARVCLNTPAKYVSCSGKHQAEDIAEMILNTAIEKGQVNARKAVRKGANGPYIALSDPEYARLDKVCQTLLESVSRGKGKVEAQVYPGATSQWPTDRGVYLASCFAVEPVSEPLPFLPGGSVFNRP